MMDGTTVRLADLCDLISDPVKPGERPDALYLGLEHLASGRLVSVGAGQASDMRSNTSAFQPSDVLYGKLRPYLDKAILADEEGICTTELLVLRAKADVDPRFLAAIVHSPSFLDHAIAGTTGVQHPRTSWAHIREFEWAAFALDEQRQIADVLWVVHEAIDRSAVLIEEGQVLKRAAMRALFSRGLRGESQKETEIGLAPESWEVTNLGSVRDRLQYGTSVKCTYNVSKYPVVRIPNIEPQKFNLRDLKYSELSDEQAKRFRLEKGDLLFIRTNGVLDRLGSCAIYSGEPANALFASYLIRVRLKQDHITPEFASYFLSSDFGTALVSGRATLASDGKYNLNSAAIDSLQLPLPTLDEQHEIVEILDIIDRKIDLHLHKRVVLEELFRVLLHKLMTGEIRVWDLDLPAVKVD